MKARVRLDPSDDTDVIRFCRMPVDDHGKPFRSRSDAHYFHRSADRCADKCLRYPVAFQDFALSLRRPTSMTAHGRHQERLGAQLLEELGR